MSHINPGLILGAKRPVALVSGFLFVTAAACISANLLWQRLPRSRKPPYEKSPAKTIPPAHEDLPYPPDALPGARDVETPYGSIRVYEWGPASGERVLFVHGISTPVVALGDLGHEMVARGYRVMLFDLFGRGYSDAPTDLPYDTRLYVTQLLLVLASSPLPWTCASGFHLVGYSLGGALSVAFARYLPHLVRTLTLVAPGGLIRPHHVGFRSWLYYSSGLVPEILVRPLVRRRIRPTSHAPPAAPQSEDMLAAEGARVDGDSDVNGGAAFAGAAISRARPHVTVSAVVAWQVDRHAGFVAAFLSTIRRAPIYASPENWAVLARILEARRGGGGGAHASSGAEGVGAGLEGGKILAVLGKDDGVIVLDEFVEDAYAVLGRDGVEFVVLDGGHELPITSSASVAAAIESSWASR
ncbi:alpha/beta-hydrolase [Nemania diffusa]|nr:alpha/beta-hydrolase [Nemania diffusa]